MTPLGRRVLLGLTAASVATLGARAQTMGAPGAAEPPDPGERLRLRLWPGAAPGLNAHVAVTEIVHERAMADAPHDRYVDGVRDPSMLVFRPLQPDGSAVLLLPGGGYAREVLDLECYESARRFNMVGATCFVLRYRLARDGWSGGADSALQDAQRAVRLIRLGAKDHGVDPARIGVLGFSAGGHLGASLATDFRRETYVAVDGADSISARPDFVGLAYPVVTMFDPYAHKGSRDNLLGADQSVARKALYSPERHVGPNTPPCFITNCADDDVVPPENSLMFAAALRAQKIPVEQHMFEVGGHGHRIRKMVGKPVAIWPDLFLNWGASHGFFPGYTMRT